MNKFYIFMMSVAVVPFVWASEKPADQELVLSPTLSRDNSSVNSPILTLSQAKATRVAMMKSFGVKPGLLDNTYSQSDRDKQERRASELALTGDLKFAGKDFLVYKLSTQDFQSLSRMAKLVGNLQCQEDAAQAVAQDMPELVLAVSNLSVGEGSQQ